MAPVLIFMGVWVTVMVVVFIGEERGLRRSGFVSSRPVPQEAIHHPFDSAATRLTGGSRVGWSDSTYPLATLTFDEEYALISGFSFAGPVWIRRDAVDRVEAVRSFLARGVRFQAADGRYDAVVFWSFTPDKVLNEMARSGWPTTSTDGLK